MCGINGLPISEPRDEDFAEALLALSGVPEEPVDDVETTYQVDPSQQVDDRFYCPFPGCRRSFAELWRLKVHYRAPPNVRGSGKERGHGMRLDHCPKCNAVLKIGGHHVRCSAREAARQLAKKPRRTGPASAGEPKGAAAQKQQQQQQQAEEAGSDSFPDSGYTSTTTPGPYMPANLPHAYMEQHQQQQALLYSFWEQQQPQQQQQQQQQQEEQPRLQVPALPEVQQLQRLQQLLNRVDQHLGFDFDPAEPAAAAALSCDHAAVHEPAAGYGEGAGCGGAAAAAAAAGYQPSVYHQQLLASLTGVAPAGYGGPAAAAAAAAADEGSSLPPYPLTVQQQQQQVGNGGCYAATCGEGQQHAASSDSSTSSGGGGGSRSNSAGGSSSLDASRVSSVAADMHYAHTASADQQQHDEQAQSQMLQLLVQHGGSAPVLGLEAAKQSALLQHTAEPRAGLWAAAAAAATASPPAAAATDEYPGAVQALLQQALQAIAASQTPQLAAHVPAPAALQQDALVPAAATAMPLHPTPNAAPAEAAAEASPATVAAVAAAAVAAVQAALLQQPAQDESHLLALLRETLA